MLGPAAGGGLGYLGNRVIAVEVLGFSMWFAYAGLVVGFVVGAAVQFTDGAGEWFDTVWEIAIPVAMLALIAFVIYINLS
jgi:hypothetical protein